MNVFRMRAGKLEVIAFISGFVLMVFELVGARILAPSIGSSTYVWTSVIGIIIMALSVGYWLGGKLADRRGYAVDIAWLALACAMAMTVMLLTYEGVTTWVAESVEDPRLQGIEASLLLFTPSSVLLGMISPYLAKLKVRSLATTGRSIASLSALNSVGGITGTFVAGFILFGMIGSRETLLIVIAMMVAISWLVVPRHQWKLRSAISAVVLVVILIPVSATSALQIDTPSARYTIFERDNVRLLATGPYAAQSGMSLVYPNELVFWYTERLAQVVEQATNKQRILVLGGGAFTLPQYLAYKYPESVIDVVEIDPELAQIARDHFRYHDPSNVRLIFDDARVYVNKTQELYDIVLVDVYGDAHVPFTLLTSEYGQQIARITASHGVVAVNAIAGLENACRSQLEALDAPYRAQFANARYAIQRPHESRSNMILIYSHQSEQWRGTQMLDLPPKVAYTDNFVPAERLQHACRQQ